MSQFFAKFMDLIYREASGNGADAENTPMDTSEPKEAENLSEFKAFIPKPNSIFFPLARSGHRCFCDDDYFYVLGGFNRNYGGLIYREFWALNLTTFQWRRYRISGDFPDKLASFSGVQFEPFSKTIIVFGGSGTCFGNSSTNEAFILHIDNQKCQINGKILETVGTKPVPKYGHAMCLGEKLNKFYVVGGTQGDVFDMKIHTLECESSSEDASNPQWTWKHVNADMKERVGRYRMEATFDEKTDTVWFFGGGDIQNVISFDTIEGFNVKTNKNEQIQAHADSEGKYPAARRCHSMTRYGREIIIAGGAGSETREIVNGRIQPNTTIMDDIWVFNLDTHRWRKHHTPLVIPVFFHDAAITKDGLLMIFGGTISSKSTHRTSAFQYAWFNTPSLKRIAAQAVRKSAPKIFEGFDGGALDYSKDCPDIYHRIVDRQYRQKRIGEQLQNREELPFKISKVDCELDYDNGKNKLSMIQHTFTGTYRRVHMGRRQGDARVARLRHIFVRRDPPAEGDQADDDSDSPDEDISASDEEEDEMQRINLNIDQRRRLLNQIFQRH